MAEGRWVNVPGKGKRWQQPSGELMMTKPGFGQGEFFQTRASELLGGLNNLIQPRYSANQMRQMTAPGLNGVLSRPPGIALSTADQRENPLLGRVPALGTDSGWWQGSSASVASPAAERAYRSEASRVAQMTAQNPDLQRYEAARQAATAKGATPEQVQSAEDIGMRIWAEKYGKTLAPNVKPGQAGYDVIQGVLNTGQMGAPLDLPAFEGASGQNLLFNPSSPLATPPMSGSTDYTQVAPSAFGAGAAALAGGYFGGAANQQQARFFNTFQAPAPGGTPLPTGMNPALAPGSPFAQAMQGGIPGYEGATGLQPTGSSLSGESEKAFATDKARALAEEFKKRQFSAGGVQ